MRVIAGKYKKTPIKTLEGEDITRPTRDMVKEALFSSITVDADTKFLDLFSGSGSIGLEALSRDAKEVLQKIIDTEENKYISKLITLISKFINLFKTNGYQVEKFDEFKNSTRNVRSHLFLDICKECYLEYERNSS